MQPQLLFLLKDEEYTNQQLKKEGKTMGKKEGKMK